mgnify:CR=1 FL=1
MLWALPLVLLLLRVPEYEPRIEDSHRKQIDVNGKLCFVAFLETTFTFDEQENRVAYHDNFDTARTIVCLFAIDNADLLMKTQSFTDSVRGLRGRDVSFLLVGNKSDFERERQVPTATEKQKPRDEMLMRVMNTQRQQPRFQGVHYFGRNLWHSMSWKQPSQYGTSCWDSN